MICEEILKEAPMSKPVTVEIVAIGSEILIGDVQDINTHWLCKEITDLGGHVRRGSLLRDEPEAIAAEVRAALDRGSDVVFTTGGLGPTADDLTLAAVARGVGGSTALTTGVAVRLHEKARQMVSDRYDELAAQGILAEGGLNPAREKMAYLPEGATPLHNPVGTAPGVLLKAGQTTIVCLPGVPAELKGIFATSLQPFLRQTFGAGVFVERVVTAECNDESLLAPVVNRVAAGHPDVYVKSWARPFGETGRLKITLSAGGSDRAAVDALLDAALTSLQAGLATAGIPLHNPAIAAAGRFHSGQNDEPCYAHSGA